MAGVVVTMDAREARLYQAMNKVVEKQAQMNAKFAEGGRVSEKAGRQSKQAFDGAAGSLEKLHAGAASYVRGLATVTAAVSAVGSAWRTVQQEQQAGLQALQSVSIPNRSLLQIATDAKDFKGLQSTADRLSLTYGVARPVSRDVLFKARSEGFEDAVEFIAANAQVIDPLSQANVAGKVPAMFKGKINSRQAIQLIQKATETSPLNFEQFAQVLPTTAAGMALLGASPEEAMATQAVLAKRFKGNGEQVAEAIASFSAEVGIKPGFSDKGLAGAMAEIQAMPEADRRKFLGSSQQLNKAFIILGEELAEIVNQTSVLRQERIAADAGGGALANRVAIANADPNLRALKQEAIATAQLAVAQSASGEVGAVAQAAVMNANARMLSKGNLFNRLADRGLADLPFVGELFPVVSEMAARGAASVGYGPEASGVIGADLSRLATTGRPDAFIGLMGAIFSPSAKELRSAAEELHSAARDMGDKTAAARAMAAGAGQ